MINIGETHPKQQYSKGFGILLPTQTLQKCETTILSFTRKQNRPKLSRQHISTLPSLFLHEYKGQLDIPSNTIIVGLIMEIVPKRNGQCYIIHWNDTNLLFWLLRTHLRQKVKKKMKPMGSYQKKGKDIRIKVEPLSYW